MPSARAHGCLGVHEDDAGRSNFHASIMGEVRALREAGLPAVEIRRMATSKAAAVVGLGNRVGTLAPGKVADLLLIDGDPLTDLESLAAVSLVVKDGRIVVRARQR